MSKTFPNATRADAQSINPLHLCIVGGKALPEAEQGPLDTDWDPQHPLHAHDLRNPLDPVDVDNVFEHGVIVPIEVIRGPNDVPMVNLGRGRVRKARLANIRRKAEGLPPSRSSSPSSASRWGVATSRSSSGQPQRTSVARRWECSTRSSSPSS